MDYKKCFVLINNFQSARQYFIFIKLINTEWLRLNKSAALATISQKNRSPKQELREVIKFAADLEALKGIKIILLSFKWA